MTEQRVAMKDRSKAPADAVVMWRALFDKDPNDCDHVHIFAAENNAVAMLGTLPGRVEKVVLMPMASKTWNPELPEEQFDFTTNVVWAVLKPWLELHFGEKCEEYEFGCECCVRWKLAEELLAMDRIGMLHDMKTGIEILEECLLWRRELLENITA